MKLEVHERLSGLSSSAGKEYGKLVQKLLLAISKPNRRFDNNVAHQIAGRRLAYRPDAFSAQPKGLAALRFRWNFDLRFAVERGNVNLATERCNGKRDGHFAMEIRAVTLKYRMGLQLHHHVQIARWAAVQTGLALAGKANTVTVIDTRWNFNR